MEMTILMIMITMINIYNYQNDSILSNQIFDFIIIVNRFSFPDYFHLLIIFIIITLIIMINRHYYDDYVLLLAL